MKPMCSFSILHSEFSIPYALIPCARKQCHEAVFVALADGLELPLAIAAVEFADDEAGLDGKVLAEVITDDFRIARQVDQADIGILDLSKVLTA